MFNFQVKTPNGVYNVNLPTNFSEVSKDYLRYATEHIQVAPEYSLVALIYRERLAVILNSSKQNKELNTSVVPVFVKAGKTDSNFINNMQLGDTIIITGSDLSIGVHVNSVLNVLSIPNIVAMCKDDSNSYKNALKNSDYCHFVEFKLVPNSAIKGILGAVKFSNVNPYVSKETKEN